MDEARFGTMSVDKYEKIKCVGSGTYGCVYEAKNKETSELVAMKKIKTLNEAEGIPITTLREIAALKALRHPYLVALKEVVLSPFKDDDDDDDSAYSNHKTETNIPFASGSIFLVLEYVPHDLTGLLQSGHVFPDIAVKYIMKQLLEALHYMHQRDVVHRDIKCSNILLTADHTVKLADYGLARTTRTPSKFTNKARHLASLAPHDMRRDVVLLLGAVDYDGSVDLWSAGCVMAELFLGAPIFPGKVEADQMQKIIDLCGNSLEDVNGISHLPHFDKFIQPEKRSWQLKSMLASKAEKSRRPLPKGFMDLLDKLLQVDPRKRFNAEQALASDYFRAHPVVGDAAHVHAWLPPITGASCHEMSTRKAKKESGAQAILNAAAMSKKKALEEKAMNVLNVAAKKPRAPLAVPLTTGARLESVLLKKEIKISPPVPALGKKLKPGEKHPTPSKPSRLADVKAESRLDRAKAPTDSPAVHAKRDAKERTHVVSGKEDKTTKKPDRPRDRSRREKEADRHRDRDDDKRSLPHDRPKRERLSDEHRAAKRARHDSVPEEGEA
ncbi:cyclin-dependent kinase [Achlya hypogyna]|uniref:Cyclin-dependent kinase 2 homolog n=1 Tax=Achlya hypogyna TaxID=1202772 RepID=A0A1V9YZ78_ACHHY|nr:cyclin-dependent kinase [Achlya hypogyna]